MPTPKQYPRELRERAVRLVAEHPGEHEKEYAAIRSVAAKLGVLTPETLREWVARLGWTPAPARA